MRTHLRKWGNSLGIRIPKPFAAGLGLDEGSAVELSLKDGALVLAPVAESEVTLEELLRGVTETNRHDEIDTGVPLGREAW